MTNPTTPHLTAIAVFYDAHTSKDGLWTLQKYSVDQSGLGQPPYSGTYVFPTADGKPQPTGVPIPVAFVLEDVETKLGRRKAGATLVFLKK